MRPASFVETARMEVAFIAYSVRDVGGITFGVGNGEPLGIAPGSSIRHPSAQIGASLAR